MALGQTGTPLARSGILLALLALKMLRDLGLFSVNQYFAVCNLHLWRLLCSYSSPSFRSPHIWSSLGAQQSCFLPTAWLSCGGLSCSLQLLVLLLSRHRRGGIRIRSHTFCFIPPFFLRRKISKRGSSAALAMKAAPAAPSSHFLPSLPQDKSTCSCNAAWNSIRVFPTKTLLSWRTRE